MPPKKSKKKPPKNAFWFFAMDWKKEKEELGQRFEDLAEVTELCSEDWKDLPHNLKSYYKQMEKDAKQINKNDPHNKFNSLGVSFVELEKQERQETAAITRMHNEIDSLMISLSANQDALKTHFFYLVHVNTYCYWGSKQIYIPCEVAISKFNLQDGVVDIFHVFPAPYTETGDLPVGYKFEALENARSVHGIPCPSDWGNSETNWSKIADDILKFMRPSNGDEIPPLYTMDGASMGGSNINCEMAAVKNFFDTIGDISGQEFRVYNLGLMFFKLYKACQDIAFRLFRDTEKAFPVEGIALKELTQDIYNYCSGISCHFHETTELFHNCSMSFVKRWVFLMCEFCCKALRISLIPNHHCVGSADVTSIPSLPKTGSADLQPRRSPIGGSHNRGSSNTATQSSESDSSSFEGWSTVAKGQSKQKTTSANGQRASGRNSESLVTIDFSKVQDPSQTRVYRTGQTANCVSEIMPDASGPSVRLPTTRGRGEMLAELLQKQACPGASFSADDFPAIGGNRPGHLSKPIARGWGRGFLNQ